jgi:hypothetical protein
MKVSFNKTENKLVKTVLFNSFSRQNKETEKSENNLWDI